MPEHVLASRQHDSVSLVAVSATTWQVRGQRDGDEPASDILGYIQHVGDTFEATSLIRPLECRAMSTLARAVESIAGAATK